ncbi:hypothetical protein EUX98_g8441 [Antrodiella citrinella]|uniref:Uncharacterized protein n=1 Tax=Antrodiella citrinella TaxID=2447956 RepID=A0A4S4M7B3_9APHY|nr:hypothetical protein EUX98_g8441 [Antrodiella citrinella]
MLADPLSLDLELGIMFGPRLYTRQDRATMEKRWQARVACMAASKAGEFDRRTQWIVIEDGWHRTTRDRPNADRREHCTVREMWRTLRGTAVEGQRRHVYRELRRHLRDQLPM